jgi:hypothetical protein
MDFNLYPLNFFVPHAFVWVDVMGFPALDFLQWGYVLFAGASFLSFSVFFSFLPHTLACLSFFWLHWFAFLFRRFTVGGSTIH